MAARPRTAERGLGRSSDRQSARQLDRRIPDRFAHGLSGPAGGHVLQGQDGSRRAVEATAGTWQLLDGQQRVNALVSIFSEHGRFGRFYLHMLKRRIPEDVVTRRADKRRSLDYIAWRSDDVGAAEPPEPRQEYIDLSRVHAWAANQTSAAILARADALDDDRAGSAVELLNEIDDAFADELTPTELALAIPRAQALLRAWAQESDPGPALHPRCAFRRSPGVRANQPGRRPARWRRCVLRCRQDRVARRRGAPRSGRCCVAALEPGDRPPAPRPSRQPCTQQGRPPAPPGRPAEWLKRSTARSNDGRTRGRRQPRAAPHRRPWCVAHERSRPSDTACDCRRSAARSRLRLGRGQREAEDDDAVRPSSGGSRRT